jgi:hypothetical protein
MDIGSSWPKLEFLVKKYAIFKLEVVRSREIIENTPGNRGGGLVYVDIGTASV